MPEQPKTCEHEDRFCAADGAASTTYWCKKCGAILQASEDNDKWWRPGEEMPEGVQESH